MANYRVTWEMDFDATSHEEAARLARRTHLDPESIATVFEVYGPDDEYRIVDLEEIDNQRRLNCKIG